MPSGELQIRHVMTNLLYAVARIRILRSNMHVWNLKVRRNPHLCCLYAITCSSGQLKRGLCVVLRPILQGALHIRSIIQQQLWRGRREVERVEGGNKPGGRVEGKKTGEGEMVCYTQAWQEEKASTVGNLNHLILLWTPNTLLATLPH